MKGKHSLPALPKLPAKEMAGPTPWSNWVIPGRVMAGAYPASLDDAETGRILTTLLELGINTFVCIQAEVNVNTPESAWRNQHGLRPYIKDAQKILSRAHETGNPKIRQQKIDFLHLPVIDGSVTTDSAMNRLAEDCIERVFNGENLYIHCWGGHGRTGTLVATMLGRMYNLPYTSAIRYCQAFHDSRIYPQGVRSPQTPVQRAQVRRLLTAQSSVSISAPISASPSRPRPPSSQVPARPVGSGVSGSKPASILSGGVRSSVDMPAASRGAYVSASPQRRPVASGRYGAPGRSPSVEYGRSSPSSVDRLAQNFSKMQSPGAAGVARSSVPGSNNMYGRSSALGSRPAGVNVR
eukprot:gene3469-13530_t